MCDDSCVYPSTNCCLATLTFWSTLTYRMTTKRWGWTALDAEYHAVVTTMPKCDLSVRHRMTSHEHRLTLTRLLFLRSTDMCEHSCTYICAIRVFIACGFCQYVTKQKIPRFLLCTLHWKLTFSGLVRPSIKPLTFVFKIWNHADQQTHSTLTTHAHTTRKECV